MHRLISALLLACLIWSCQDESASQSPSDTGANAYDISVDVTVPASDAHTGSTGDAHRVPTDDAQSAPDQSLDPRPLGDMGGPPPAMTQDLGTSDIGLSSIDEGIEMPELDAEIIDQGPPIDAEPEPEDARAPRDIDIDAPRCGGPENILCLNGYDCVDDPRDGCVPENGAQACVGFCMPSQPDVCPRPRRCNARIVEFCMDGEFVEEEVCPRNQRCKNAECRPLPRPYGTVCSLNGNRRLCDRQGLHCGGLAIIPYCLHPSTANGPPRPGNECYGYRDCQPSLLCTRAGRCSAGAPGDACHEDQDCQGSCVQGACGPN